MSNFLDLTFTFTYIDRNYKFVIDTTNNATSIKNNTLKISGYVDIDELIGLSAWLKYCYTDTCGKKAKSYKVEGITPNGKALGCFPTSISFTATSHDHKAKENFAKGIYCSGNISWKAHIVLSYDKITD